MALDGVAVWISWNEMVLLHWGALYLYSKHGDGGGQRILHEIAQWLTALFIQGVQCMCDPAA